LNKLINIEVSSVKLAWNTLFKILNVFDALLTFTRWIIYLISSCNKIELNDIVSNINDLEMLLMFVWNDDKKNFFRRIFVFSSNKFAMWSKLLLFSNKNYESFFSNWLLILTHFAKHQIDFNSLLNLCICNLKCEYFTSLMILFLWSLYFR